MNLNEYKNNNLIVEFADVKMLANYARSNKNIELVNAITTLEEKYDFDSLYPVVKALYYSQIGKAQFKEQTLFMYKQLPKYKLHAPTNKRCYHDYDPELLAQENIHPYIVKIKNANPTKICEVKPTGKAIPIPHKFHNVWTTSSVNSEKSIENAFNKNNLFQKHNADITEGWEHNMWLVSSELTTPNIHNLMKDANFTIRYSNELTNSKNSIFLANAANCFAEMQLYTLSSNLIRFAVLVEHGGVYTDGDYKLLTNIDPLVDNFHTVVGHLNALGTGFLATADHSTLFNKVAEMNIRNIDLQNAPEYVKYPCRTIDKITSSSDLTMALTYYKNNDYNSNEELFMPPRTVYKFAGYNPFLKCPREFLSIINIIGEDQFQHSWNETTTEHLNYL